MPESSFCEMVENDCIDSLIARVNPFTVIPELTRYALTIVQRELRVNSGLAICVYSLTVYPE